MTNNAKFMVVIGVPDLIGGTFYGTFESEASASEWGETNYPTTRETGRQWYVIKVHEVAIPPVAMTDRLAAIEEMAERAERKGYSLSPEDVLAAVRDN